MIAMTLYLWVLYIQDIYMEINIVSNTVCIVFLRFILSCTFCNCTHNRCRCTCFNERRKEESTCSKQGQTNNKAKLYSTPKAVTFTKKTELPQVGLEPTTPCICTLVMLFT